MKARLKNMIFDINQSENGKEVLINGKPYKLEILNLEDNFIELTINNKNYRSTFETTESGIKVNDPVLGFFQIDFPSQAQLLAEELDAQSAQKNQSGDIKALMPGLVSKLMVTEGDQVEIGQTLFILEAMKMENAIQSEVSGTINAITVNEGQRGAKGDLILEITE